VLCRRGRQLGRSRLLESALECAARGEEEYEEGMGNNAPQCARNCRLLGRTLTSSSSMRPVIETESKVRYATTTPSSFPDLHSSMKSARFVAAGVTSSAIELRESQAFWALDSSRHVRPRLGGAGGLL
jgi:hypothetical protein